MPTESSFLKAKIAAATDEIKGFPAEVDSPRTKTIDKFLEEHSLTVKKWAASETLKSGELAIQEKSGETFTMPAVGTANQIIGVFSAVAETKLTTAAKFVGDFMEASAMKLTTNQHVTLQSNGTNWMILAGEPKREQNYASKTFTKAEAEAGVEASASRPSAVILSVAMAPIAEAIIGVIVAGTGLTYVFPVTVIGTTWPITIPVIPPGQKWSVKATKGTIEKVEAMTLPL